ncbi:MAG TPA: hypothetical protein P5032_12185 [Candidatus Competibacter sp.]|nr:hypothetical protein [Candidatus Competibacteraceae bacterium]HRW66480.1 hypothetical protein [Candidatus Competibacter sp.]
MLKPDLVHLISAGYAAFLQPARTPDSVISPLQAKLRESIERARQRLQIPKDDP